VIELKQLCWIAVLGICITVGNTAAATPKSSTLNTLQWQDPAPPLSVHFKVHITAPHAQKTTLPIDWYFSRNATEVALLKGPIDEIWRRDAQGNISFARVFHDDQKVVDYSAGELRTLGVEANWAALSAFIDPSELAAMKVVSKTGTAWQQKIKLTSKTRGSQVSVEWQPALQLPTQIVRHSTAHGQVKITLQTHTPRSEPNKRSAHYLHLDAADFGDQGDERVVKQSQTLDIRQGWRQAHD
jgi:hypothetical protein